MSFPGDDFTPFGYLDLPGHARRLSPRGVLRSWDAGFRWHFPAWPGSYGGRGEIYHAGLRLALDGAAALRDFNRVACPYHSKNLFRFELRRAGARATAEFHTAGDDVLRAVVLPAGARRVALHAEYTRRLAAHGEWGESGLVGRRDGDLLVLQAFEDGEAIALWASREPDDLGVTASATEAETWCARGAPGLPPEGFVPVIAQPGELAGLHAVLGFAGAGELEVILARGRTAAEALARLAAARSGGATERARLLAEDDAFWATAPQLAGDWPAHWRRGLVYDYETLRMMVKAPLGIYRHVWDAMQIQSPRVVLAETAIDALLLSYADPQLAAELFAGAFLDAPEPNVPCSREDGSSNMVAADGTVCGTAPSWGYPWLVLERLLALAPEPAWLESLYPRLAAYLDWWLANRRDAHGWLVYACSWESGQDDSPRFGAQPLGGGHPVRHVRPADLQAAFAHAAAVQARCARRLGRERESGRWERLAAEFAARSEQLWNGARYADFDTRSGELTGVDDIMLLAPVALGVAAPARAAALRGAIAAVDPAALTWPMFAWTAVAAAGRAGLPEHAATLAAAVCERAYGFWDARPAHPERTLPGIACEYWPLSGRCGGEGYGWGAFGVHLLLDTLLGFTPGPDGLRLRPNLPVDWRAAGREYRVRLAWRGEPLDVALLPRGERVTLRAAGREWEIGWGEDVLVAGEVGRQAP
jgi:hypothetical protein